MQSAFYIPIDVSRTGKLTSTNGSLFFSIVSHAIVNSPRVPPLFCLHQSVENRFRAVVKFELGLVVEFGPGSFRLRLILFSSMVLPGAASELRCCKGTAERRSWCSGLGRTDGIGGVLTSGRDRCENLLDSGRNRFIGR